MIKRQNNDKKRKFKKFNINKRKQFFFFFKHQKQCRKKIDEIEVNYHTKMGKAEK